MQPAIIGPFQVLREVGRGGMGEVYLGLDTRLDRQVAIKALPSHLANDSDRLARLQHEAKVLASLNHPGLGAIYGLEEAAGHQYLILEYVEGQTLAERLAKGAVPVDEAMRIAAQIAEALEAAHEKGVVHRDLKPGNVMITPEGVVKVLDFGLARREEAPSSSAALADSPTVASPRAHSPTIPGAILGTAGYMSPEQARGMAVDKRSDIFSFGCVLYELLAGEQPFPGATVPDALGATLHREPDWTALPPATPARIRELLVSCLVKERKNRLRDIGDARLAIEQAHGARGRDTEPSAPARGWAPWAAAALLCAMISTFAWLGFQPKQGKPLPVVRSSIAITPGSLLEDGEGPVALSPDGSTLAFMGGAAGEAAILWIRPLASLAAQPLRGTEDATYPFWSPDGKHIGFFSNGKLRRIPATGGTATALADVNEPRGGTWGIDGTIVFAPRLYGPLWGVAASGGTPVPITQVSSPDSSHRLPWFLPDGKHLLYTSFPIRANNSSEVVLHDLETGKGAIVLREESLGLYAPPGYLLFVRNSRLMAQALDVSKGALVGEATVLADNVSLNPNRATGAISVSVEGTLVYRPAGPASRLEWFDLEGRSLGKVGEPANFVSVDLAPGGDQAAAIVRREDGQLDIWICDTVRGTRVKFVEDVLIPGIQWSPAGGRIAYRDTNGTSHVRGLDGAMDVTLTEGWATSWSRDGKYLSIVRQNPATNADIYIVDADGGSEPRAFAHTEYNEHHCEFSPDGKWLAYVTDRSGWPELVVAPVSGAGPIHQVTSSRGGTAAGLGYYLKWTDDGTLIHTDSSGETLLAVPTTNTGAGIQFGAPTEVLGALKMRSGLFTDTRDGKPFSIARDGKRVLAALPIIRDESDSLVLIQNWPAAVGSQR